MRPLSQLNQYRNRQMEARFELNVLGEHDDHWGYFLIKTSGHPKPMRVVASRFREHQPESKSNFPWNHVSVSLPNRTPTWKEMSYIKELFFEPHEVAMQLHVGEADHVSNHDYCLHIWQPAKLEIPTPPAIMVGIKELGTVSQHNK
jgi:hypothetical protein